jgi:CDP-glycerol glycerophosphotransferase (TagB/SpsB family)
MFYDTVHSSYAGSLASRDKVVLRLSPNKCHADKEKETLKGIPVEIVGVPKMDEWAEKRNRLITKRNANPEMKPVVALSFHWDCKVCPETRSAFPHFANAIEELSEHVELIGHGHPRILAELRPFYHELGIRIAADFPRVLRDADMYICDNSSTIFEFAYLNKPVVLLNNPSYRKDVEQPGNPRFWKYADIGPQVDKPEELVGAVFEAWNNFGHYLPRIQQATDEIFTYTDGKCAERAVDAIIRMLKTY